MQSKSEGAWVGRIALLMVGLALSAWQGWGQTGTPAIRLSPESLDFGRQQVVTTSAAQSVMLTNRSNAVLFLTSIGASGDFAQTNTCGDWVAAGTSCTIGVTFTPRASGKRCGMVTITGNMTGSAKVRLKGKGFAAATTADYYVSPEGNDTSGDGSAANPWATIAHADTQVGPGSTVHVGAGTYTGSFNTNASGTASAYITYISDTKWGAKIVGGSFSTWSNYGAYVEIQDFDVTGPKSSCCEGIYTAGNATRIIGNNVHDTQSANGCNVTGGAGIDVDATNAQVIGNYVHNNGPYPTACGYIHGIYIASSSNPGSGAVVWNNLSFDNSGWGIQLWHSATNEILVNNTLFGNLTGGIVVGASGVTDDNTIVNNNIAFNNTRGIFEEGTTGTHNVYTDNLLYQNSGCNDASNCNLALQNGNAATGTVSANPQFVNFTGDATGDYHLQSSSPAIGVGTGNAAPTTDYDGVARPQGCAWSIGAYEFPTPDQDDQDGRKRKGCSCQRGCGGSELDSCGVCAHGERDDDEERRSEHAEGGPDRDGSGP